MTSPGTPPILLVEDDPSTLELLEFFLRDAGYKTNSVVDGASALRAVKLLKPALVILDLMLPEIHGLSVCHKIKNDPETKGVKVFMISVKSFPADQRQVAEAGADLFMPKPLDKKAFLAAVEKFLQPKKT